MDPGAIAPTLIRPAVGKQHVGRSRFLTVWVAMAVCAALVVAREIFAIPKPTIVTLACVFGGWLVVSWPFRSRNKIATAPGIARLLVPWGVISLAMLGGVYRLDRGGWLWYRLSGYNLTVAEDLRQESRISPADFVRQHPSFSLHPADPTQVVLPRGEYVISRSLVVPPGASLTIEPGTTVRLKTGCSLISYGPLVARGTEDEPIAFAAHNRWFKWGVIGLVDAGQAILEHVRVENARQAFVNGHRFPGGLSFIDTDAEITNCQFIDMFGKDAVYVRQGHVRIRNNRVQNAFKDGVDLDGGSGEIRQNLFIDCGDEGIDVSENAAVDIRENTIRDQRGGRIAADRGLAQIRLANKLEYSSGE